MLLHIAVHFLVLHAPNGTTVTINPALIASMHEPREGSGYLTEGVRCLINTTDGKFVTVVETCADVRAAIIKNP
jgi:hypothetical protein